MQQKLYVDIATLSKKTEWLKEQKRIIQNERKQLLECLEDIKLCWKGVAAANFCSRACKDIDMLDEYLSLIDNVISDYISALSKYRNSEEQINDIIQAIGI